MFTLKDENFNKKISDRKTNQSYKKIVRGEEKLFTSYKFKNLKAKKIMAYGTDVYVSDKAKIKPRALHMINKNTEEAINSYGLSLDNKPTIVIVDSSELGFWTWGLYDATTNIVYYVPEINDNYTCDPIGYTEYHEVWHFKQVEDFRQNGYIITKENYLDYIDEVSRKAKSNIDSYGITEYNVGEISEYAKEMYAKGRFDEVEAEYECIKKVGGKEK